MNDYLKVKTRNEKKSFRFGRIKITPLWVGGCRQKIRIKVNRGVKREMRGEND